MSFATIVRFAGLASLCVLSSAMSCRYIDSPVPIVGSGRGYTPLETGEYEIMTRESGPTAPPGSPWKVAQTGLRIQKVGDHYVTSFLDHALTVVDGTHAFPTDRSVRDIFSEPSQRQLAARSPQQQFLASQWGYAFERLTDDVSLVQFPLTFASAELPAKQTKDDIEKGKWTIGLLRRLDSRTWDYSICDEDKCRAASVALFGGKWTCDQAGKCETVPNVPDFDNDPETSRRILKKYVESFAIDRVLRFVRVGS